jgi:pseudaminic acid synthase
MEPNEFKLMVKTIRDAEMTLGKITYDIKNSDKLRRRSLFAISDISKGERLSEENFRSIRPGHGIHPMYWNQVNGLRVLVDIPKGTPLDFGMLDTSKNDEK